MLNSPPPAGAAPAPGVGGAEPPNAGAGAPAPKVNVAAPPPGAATAPVVAPPNENGDAGGAPAPGVVGCEPAAGAPKVKPPVEGLAPMAGAAEGAPKENPPGAPAPVAAGEAGAGEGVAPKVKGAGAEFDVALAAPKGEAAGAAAEEEDAPKANGDGAGAPAPAAAPLALPKVNDGAVAAGDGGAGEGDAEAPNVNAGLLAPPKRLPPEVEAAGAGAPKGEGDASFLSEAAPNVKPPDPDAGAPNGEGAPDPPLAAPNANAGAGVGGAGEPSSSMPESPASSVVAGAAVVGASPPKRGAAGDASFFSSAWGVAGVVPKAKVGAAEAAGAEAAEPKLNGEAAAGLSAAAAGLDEAAPNAKGDAAAPSALAAPKENSGAGPSFFCECAGNASSRQRARTPQHISARDERTSSFFSVAADADADDAPNAKAGVGATFFSSSFLPSASPPCCASLTISATGLPNAANGFAAAGAAAGDLAVSVSEGGGITSVGLSVFSPSSPAFFAGAPNEKAGAGAGAGADVAGWLALSLRMAPKKLGLADEDAAPLVDGVASDEAPNENVGLDAGGTDVDGLAKKSDAGAAGLAGAAASSFFFSAAAAAPKEKAGAVGFEAEAAGAPKEKGAAALGASAVEGAPEVAADGAGGGAPRRLRRLEEPSSAFFSADVDGAAGAAAAEGPNEKLAGNLMAGIWILLSASSSSGGKSSSSSFGGAKTRDDEACCRDEWLLPGRSDDRPEAVEGAVEGKDDGAGNEILGTDAEVELVVVFEVAGTGGAGEGDLAFVLRLAAGVISSSSCSCSCSCSSSFCSSRLERVDLRGVGAGEGDLAPAFDERELARVERRDEGVAEGGSRRSLPLLPLPPLAAEAEADGLSSLCLVALRVMRLGLRISSSTYPSSRSRSDSLAPALKTSLMSPSASSLKASSSILLLLSRRLFSLARSRSASSRLSRSRSSRSCSSSARRRSSRARRTAWRPLCWCDGCGCGRGDAVGSAERRAERAA